MPTARREPAGPSLDTVDRGSDARVDLLPFRHRAGVGFLDALARLLAGGLHALGGPRHGLGAFLGQPECLLRPAHAVGHELLVPANRIARVLPTALPAHRPRLAFAQRLEPSALKLADA